MNNSTVDALVTLESGEKIVWELKTMMAYDLLGPYEVADLLGVQLGTVRQWRKRGVMPEAWGTRSGVTFWDRRVVLDWARRTGRV